MTDATTPEPKPEGGVRSLIRFGVLWPVILLTYLSVFSITGYIAFFQAVYNPASSITAGQTAMLKGGDEAVKAYVIRALDQESAAFKAKKDLAFQSFNVVLGALLGFLSASAVAIVRRNGG